MDRRPLNKLERCAEFVGRDFAFTSGQCARKGIIREEGKLWCKQHAPSAAKKRREERDARWHQKQRLYAVEPWDTVITVLVNKGETALANNVEAFAKREGIIA